LELAEGFSMKRKGELSPIVEWRDSMGGVRLKLPSKAKKGKSMRSYLDEVGLFSGKVEEGRRR